MSFILDALRKSDTRRRSQQGPQLAQPSTMAQRSAHRRWPKLALAVLLLIPAVVAAVYVWPESVLRVLPREAPPPRPTLSTLSIPELPGEPAAVARVVSTEPTATPIEAEPRILETPEIELALPSGSEPEPELEPIIALAPEVPGVARDPEPASAQANETAAKPTDYLLFWELPLAVRQNLPPLNMSLHMYTDDAPGRFVLINGQRRREGDQLAGGGELVEIRSEGAILESRGYRFLLGR